jgi:hypothetical protein
MSESEQTGTTPQNESSQASRISELSILLGKCSQELFYAVQDNESLSSQLSRALEENAVSPLFNLSFSWTFALIFFARHFLKNFNL